MVLSQRRFFQPSGSFVFCSDLIGGTGIIFPNRTTTRTNPLSPSTSTPSPSGNHSGRSSIPVTQDRPGCPADDLSFTPGRVLFLPRNCPCNRPLPPPSRTPKMANRGLIRAGFCVPWVGVKKNDNSDVIWEMHQISRDVRGVLLRRMSRGCMGRLRVHSAHSGRLCGWFFQAFGW